MASECGYRPTVAQTENTSAGVRIDAEIAAIQIHELSPANAHQLADSPFSADASNSASLADCVGIHAHA
jgi:hypothetical protein